MAAIGETHEMSVSDGDGSGPVLRGSAKPSDGGMGRNGGIQVHAPIAKHSFEVTKRNKMGSKGVTIFVGKIPDTLEDAFLRSLMEQFGTIVDWKRPSSKFTFCSYSSPKEAISCLRVLTDVFVDGQQLMIKPDEDGARVIEHHLKIQENIEGIEAYSTPWNSDDHKRKEVIEKMLQLRQDKLMGKKPRGKPKYPSRIYRNREEITTRRPEEEAFAFLKKSKTQVPFKKKKIVSIGSTFAGESSAEMDMDSITSVNDLWNFPIAWKIVSSSRFRESMLRPWLENEVEDFFGRSCEEMTESVVSALENEVSPQELMEMVETAFGSDVETFVAKLWIFIIENSLE